MSEWQLVPVEPTLDMLQEAVLHQNAHEDEPSWGGLYRAMIAAAPPAPTSTPAAEVVMQFGQRAIVALAGAPDLPLGAKLYAHPAPAEVQSEPVAWRYRFARGVRWDFSVQDPAEWRDADVTADGLYTHPAPVEITDEMVEAACEAHLRAWADCEQSSYVYSESDIDDDARACMRAALRAAMGVR